METNKNLNDSSTWSFFKDNKEIKGSELTISQRKCVLENLLNNLKENMRGSYGETLPTGETTLMDFLRIRSLDIVTMLDVLPIKEYVKLTLGTALGIVVAEENIRVIELEMLSNTTD